MLTRKYYNGYLFSGGTEPLFNPTLVALLPQQVSMRKLDVDSVLQRDVAGVDLLDDVLDDNVKLSPSVLALARKLPAGERCVTALVGDSTPLAGFKIKSTFHIDEIVPELAGQPEEHVRTAQALLYYQGLVTFADNGRFDTLRVPNTVVRLSMFDVLVRKVQFSEIDTLLRAPSAALLKQLLQEIADKGPLESEADMQREVELVFNWLCRGRGLKSQLRTVGKKRADLVVEGADGFIGARVQAGAANQAPRLDPRQPAGADRGGGDENVHDCAVVVAHAAAEHCRAQYCSRCSRCAVPGGALRSRAQTTPRHRPTRSLVCRGVSRT
jgi:hypothetical protein